MRGGVRCARNVVYRWRGSLCERSGRYFISIASDVKFVLSFLRYCRALTDVRAQDCSKVVAAKFFPVDATDGSGRQFPLCETDYFRRLNLLCSKCGAALRGSYITALGQYNLLVDMNDTDSRCRHEISRRAFHLLRVSDGLWSTRLVLRTRWIGLLSLPLLDSLRRQMYRMSNGNSQAIRRNQSE